jgi:hypothetical protein
MHQTWVVPLFHMPPCTYYTFDDVQGSYTGPVTGGVDAVATATPS